MVNFADNINWEVFGMTQSMGVSMQTGTINGDDTYVLGRQGQGYGCEPGRTSRRGFGIETPTTEQDAFESDLDRRESALNARIAEFENLVRRTQVAAAERIEKIAESERELTRRWGEVQQAIQALNAREAELDRRESAIAGQLATIEEKNNQLRASREEFQNRSERILRTIGEQKDELRKLVAAQLGK